MIPEFNSFWHWLSWFAIIVVVAEIIGVLTGRKK